MGGAVGRWQHGGRQEKMDIVDGQEEEEEKRMVVVRVRGQISLGVKVLSWPDWSHWCSCIAPVGAVIRNSSARGGCECCH